MPEDMPDRMPEDMPEDMSDRMPEDMPDRMPEDMSVRKCINVMVGITRSKVFFFFLGLTCNGLEQPRDWAPLPPWFFTPIPHLVGLWGQSSSCLRHQSKELRKYQPGWWYTYKVDQSGAP